MSSQIFRIRFKSTANSSLLLADSKDCSSAGRLFMLFVVVKHHHLVVKLGIPSLSETLEHLNDPNTYKELDGDPTNSICRGVNQILHKLHSEGLLNKKMVDFCSPPLKARLARLYFLKKLHKTPMGIHPIVSSCESPTENISQFIDYWLQPIMKGNPSYLKDTTELINQLNELRNNTNGYTLSNY